MRWLRLNRRRVRANVARTLQLAMRGTSLSWVAAEARPVPDADLPPSAAATPAPGSLRDGLQERPSLQ